MLRRAKVLVAVLSVLFLAAISLSAGQSQKSASNASSSARFVLAKNRWNPKYYRPGKARKFKNKKPRNWRAPKTVTRVR